MTTLVSLVGGQQTPIFLAQEHFKPDVSILVHTADSAQQAIHLKSFFESKFIHCKVVLEQVDPYDINEAASLARKINDENSSVILNYTGGTKPMSVAFYSVFDSFGGQSVYVITQDQRFQLSRCGQQEIIPMESHIRIEDWFSLLRSDISISYSDSPVFGGLYGVILDLMVMAYRKLDAGQSFSNYRSKLLKHKQRDADNISNVTINFENEYMQVQYNSDDTITIKSDQGVVSTSKIDWYNYVGGGWFEDWTYYRLKDTGMYDDIRQNVVIKSVNDESLPMNEIDVMAIRHSIPYFFECKAGKIDSAAINNLANSKRTYGGALSRGVFVGFLPERFLKVPLRQRIKDNRIHIISGWPNIENMIKKVHERDFRGQAL